MKMKNVLNYGETESHPRRVSNIKQFSNTYNWKGIKFPSNIDGWKTFENNNSTIAVTILYIKEKKMSSLYLKN